MSTTDPFMRYLFLNLLLIFTLIPASLQAQVEGIAAVVNEDVITFSDLNDRVHLVAVSSGLPPGSEAIDRITPQVLDSLIEDQLKLQEAERLGVTVSDENIAQGIAQMAQQNNLSAEQFAQSLKANKISVPALEAQLRAQIAWNSVVQVLLRPKINIGDSDVEDVLERMNQAMGKTEYLVSEIFLPVETPAQETEMGQLASRLVDQIRQQRAPFFRVAQQFSKAAGAARGGDLGWIRQGQLPEELDAALETMEKGQVSNPVRAIEGYHIFLLRDMRAVTEETVPSSHQITQDLGMERLQRLARGHLQDLKAAAFIERRVGP